MELADEFSVPQVIPDASVLTITWSDAEGNTFEGAKVECLLRDGRLLIPMGMNGDWLLSDINDFSLTITAPDNGPLLYETTYKKLKASEEDSAFIKELSLMQLDINRY